jgi:hypothetical protein
MTRSSFNTINLSNIGLKYDFHFSCLIRVFTLLVWSSKMQDDNSSHDPFNWGYLIAALGVLLALPLMHVILGWFVFYL